MVHQDLTSVYSIVTSTVLVDLIRCIGRNLFCAFFSQVRYAFSVIDPFNSWICYNLFILLSIYMFYYTAQLDDCSNSQLNVIFSSDDGNTILS